MSKKINHTYMRMVIILHKLFADASINTRLSEAKFINNYYSKSWVSCAIKNMGLEELESSRLIQIVETDGFLDCFGFRL